MSMNMNKKTPTVRSQRYSHSRWLVAARGIKEKWLNLRVLLTLKMNHERYLERELIVMQKILAEIEVLGDSRYYQAFLDQMHSQELSEIFSRVLGSEEKMAMVIYGIGRLEAREKPCSQLALALLMKQDLPWIGDIEVYDPITCRVEAKVMSDLGCTVLTVNERCKRKVLKPTLFFMPYNHILMYGNLLVTNWELDKRRKIALLGNSFGTYRDIFHKYSEDGLEWLFESVRFTKEIPTDACDDVKHFIACGKLNWLFFGECDGGL